MALATTAKAKLLLRELKTAKADLADAKQRCSQLEEENKILREAYGKDDHPADDEMVYAIPKCFTNYILVLVYSILYYEEMTKWYVFCMIHYACQMSC